MTPLDQLTAALTGRYEIEREIGAGGMATVYLARDVKHGRPVALKVLKPELGAVLGVERFLAEIQVTANLQHPNLLPLFDSGEAGGLLFYVMPYVEGESLRARIDREKQLPVDEAVRLSVAIAGALEYAHQHGVIHRDLKPENILLQAGQPVIADFGIALAVSKAGGARVTQTGLSLGTPQYMSPEQATGDRAIDSRTDVYSLAAMTYEMLTGEPPHSGSTAQSIIAKLMTEDVRPLTVLRRSVPAHVDAAVRHALEKLAADRFASAAEFSLALTGARPFTLPTGSTTVGVAAVAGSGAGMSGRARVLVAGLALIAVGGVGTSLWQLTRPAPPSPQLMRFELGLPDSVTLFAGGGTKLALSRDGSRLVLAGVNAASTALYLRRLDDPFATLVRGTEVAAGTSGSSPRFSPDGEWLAFSGESGVRKVPVTGGTPQSVADSGACCADWVDNRSLVYTTRGGELWIATPEGRGQRRVAAPDTARRIFGFRWPAALPGGTHVLVTIDHVRGMSLDSMGLGVVALEDGSITDLGVEGTNPFYVASGHILFGRAGGLLYSAPFSLKTLALTGPPTLILEGVWQGGGGATGFAVADNGTLAFHTGTSSNDRRLVFVDRDGTQQVLPGAADRYESPRLSPDEARVVVSTVADNRLATDGDIWLVEIATGARQRLAEAGGGGRAEWSRDGTRVLFLRDSGGKRQAVSRAWDRSGEDRLLVDGTVSGLFELAVGPERGWWAMRATTDDGNRILFAHADSLGAPRALTRSGRSREATPTISADGRLLAYVSNESSRGEVYVQPIPGPGPRVQVSVEGGAEPVWSKRGSTLFFRGPTHLIAAEMESGSARVTRRDTLFVDQFARTPQGSDQMWDVSSDGSRFLMLQSLRLSENGSVSVLVNWQQLPSLRRGDANPP